MRWKKDNEEIRLLFPVNYASCPFNGLVLWKIISRYYLTREREIHAYISVFKNKNTRQIIFLICIYSLLIFLYYLICIAYILKCINIYLIYIYARFISTLLQSDIFALKNFKTLYIRKLNNERW